MFNLREFLGLSYYRSAFDQFLKAFNLNNPKLSASQRKEVDKYQRIYQLRDNPTQEKVQKKLWDKF